MESTKKVDTTLEWKGLGTGLGKWDSKCRIRVYHHDDLEIILASNVDDNKGSSVEDCAEVIAGLCIARFDVDFKKFIWIEHTPPMDIVQHAFGKKNPQMPEFFKLVVFKVNVQPNPLDPRSKTGKAYLVEPSRKFIKREHVESLIGEAL